MHLSLMPALPSHARLQNMTVKQLDTTMPELGGMFWTRNSIIAIRNVRSTPFLYWGNAECLHHASLLGEGKNIASVSGKVTSDEVRKLYPEPFPCGPRYLL